MERAGFLERRPDPSDQRLWRVYLTGAGQAVQTDVQEVWRTLQWEAFAGFSEEEREAPQRFFGRMRENLARVTGGQ